MINMRIMITQIIIILIPNEWIRMFIIFMLLLIMISMIIILGCYLSIYISYISILDISICLLN